MTRGLITFIRNPEKGKVKTRLAKAIGDDAALEVYRKLLAHTRVVCEATQAKRFLFYADSIPVKDEWDGRLFSKQLQNGVDLGARMRHAFEVAFGRGCNEVTIIGSDCPQISASIIEQAFDGLAQHDIVIGPATDGGYYLLGMKTLYPQPLEGKTWSTATVFNDTLKDIRQLGLSYYLLPVLTDVDEAEDLAAMHYLP